MIGYFTAVILAIISALTARSGHIVAASILYSASCICLVLQSVFGKKCEYEK